jgi:hypothetical protein
MVLLIARELLSEVEMQLCGVHSTVVEVSLLMDGVQSPEPCVDEQKTPDATNAYPVPTKTAIEMIAITSSVPTLIFAPGNSKLNCPELFTLTERTQNMISQIRSNGFHFFLIQLSLFDFRKNSSNSFRAEGVPIS